MVVINKIHQHLHSRCKRHTISEIHYYLALICICIFFNNFCYCQGFEKQYHTLYSPKIGPLIETPNHDFIIITNRVYYDQNYEVHPIDLMAYKVSSIGDIIDSLSITEPGYAITDCLTATICNDSVVAFASLQDTLTNKGEGVIISFDLNLTHYSKRYIILPLTTSIISSVYKESDTLFDIAGNSNDSLPPYGGMFVMKVTKTGQIIESILETNSFGQFPILIYHQVKDEFRVLSSNSLWYFSKNIDHDSLMWVKYVTFQVLVSQPTCKLLDDSTFLTIGYGLRLVPGLPDPVGDIVLLKRSIDTTISAMYTYQNQDTNNQISNNAFDFINQQQIYIVSMSDMGALFYLPWDMRDVWISVNKVNSNGELIWHKKYGQNAAYVFPRILTTQDQGFIVACQRYDWVNNGPNFKSDLYIIKKDLNGEGQANGIENNPPHNSRNTIVHQVKDELLVDFPSISGEMNLFDFSGRLVAKNKLNSGSNVIHTDFLHQGLYFYLIKRSDSRLIETGKILIK
ncbi:MAG: hypothetical protein NTU44_16425 [Bacteroidetes bacterium]|nr:hypothetical protein [Bacteroidota bacterium]